MSILPPMEVYLANVENDLPACSVSMDKASALEALRELTGVDFGYDGKKWREWLEQRGLVRPLPQDEA